ncbi:MAG: hypothetical protein ACHP7A_03700 [Caulobacterales bacterium]|jgi:hypothetical protein
MKTVQTTLAAAALAAVFAGVASQAEAQGSSQATPDVRCLLTMGAIASTPANRGPGTVGVYYFLGRINVRAPGLDVTSALKAERAKLPPSALPAEAKRCEALMQEASETLRTAQAALSSPPPAAAAASAPK